MVGNQKTLKKPTQTLKHAKLHSHSNPSSGFKQQDTLNLCVLPGIIYFCKHSRIMNEACVGGEESEYWQCSIVQEWTRACKCLIKHACYIDCASINREGMGWYLWWLCWFDPTVVSLRKATTSSFTSLFPHIAWGGHHSNLTQTGPPGWPIGSGSNPGPACCEATVLNTAPPHCPGERLENYINMFVSLFNSGYVVTCDGNK